MRTPPPALQTRLSSAATHQLCYTLALFLFGMTRCPTTVLLRKNHSAPHRRLRYGANRRPTTLQEQTEQVMRQDRWHGIDREEIDQAIEMIHWMNWAALEGKRGQ